jgi:hypothetical protein
MAYRGRLIHPLIAELRQLDTNATATSNGYDPNWKTPTVSYPGGVRAKGAVYKSPIRLRCQVEQVQEAGQQRTQTGNVPDSRIVLVFHYVDLLAASLVGPDGRSLLRPNDKLVALYTKAGAIEKTYSPELYAVEVLDGGHGLGGRRNLAIVTFDDRPQGIT